MSTCWNISLERFSDYLFIYSAQALEYIGEKISANRASMATGFTSKKNTPPMADAAEILANLVLNHVPVVNFDFREKVSSIPLSCKADDTLTLLCLVMTMSGDN